MAPSARKRQQTSHERNAHLDFSHMTRPRLEPLVQQTLESVGMRARKAFSDAQYKKEMALPARREAMQLAIVSNAEITKPLPLYEIKSAKDPWAQFRETGRRQKEGSLMRGSKRGRGDEEIKLSLSAAPSMTQVESEVASSTIDPNDIEFTNPPWYVIGCAIANVFLILQAGLPRIVAE